MRRMRIACPSCAAEYDVPDRLLAGPARSLRCARCGAGFALPGAAPTAAEAVPAAEAPPRMQMPAPPAPAPEARLAPPPAVPDRSPEAMLPGSPAALRRAWAASIALVAGAALSLVLFRAALMEAWPPAVRLFAALGLA